MSFKPKDLLAVTSAAQKSRQSLIPVEQAAIDLANGGTHFKSCADCSNPILQEQMVYVKELDGLDTISSFCVNCRWKKRQRLESQQQQQRSPHASSECTPSELAQEIQLSISPPEDEYLSSSDSSYSTFHQDRVSETDGSFQPPSPLSPTPYTTNAIKESKTSQKSPSSNRKSPRLRRVADSRTESSLFSDITRLRVQRTSKHCLYPGSTFKGIQKSGRSDYDVTVTILDVDFSSSFLCGYLEIRGLTEDWPELTTYFDAEIIGAQYSFLTRGWGATHEDDLHHWSQFPAFNSKEIQNDIRFPRYTLCEESVSCCRGRRCLFMRWKERFLVPDHRVKDIVGASFAGFYYICVEFDIPSSQQQVQDCGLEARLPTLNDRSLLQDQSIPARMTGFYFHKSTEPNQELSLHHAPDGEMGMGNGSFEWR